MNKNIKVSFIIPAYNVERYIRRCIQSAMNQTLKEIEIIVVNDGSSDQTESIIDELRQIDDRIILINKDNGGISSARNAGLKVAKGEFIQHLDGDDWIEKESSYLQYEFARSHDVDMVATNTIFDDDNGKVKVVNELSEGVYSSKDFFRSILLGTSSTSCWNKFVRKSLYDDINFPEHISYGDDLSTVPILAIISTRIGKMDASFLHYIYNPESITNSSAMTKGYQVILACKCIKEYLKATNNLEEFQEEYSILFSGRMSRILNNNILKDNVQYDNAVNEVLDFVKYNSISTSEMHMVDRVMFSMLRLFPSREAVIFFVRLKSLMKNIKLLLNNTI